MNDGWVERAKEKNDQHWQMFYLDVLGQSKGKNTKGFILQGKYIGIWCRIIKFIWFFIAEKSFLHKIPIRVKARLVEQELCLIA